MTISLIKQLNLQCVIFLGVQSTTTHTEFTRTHHLVEYLDGGDHPLEFELERPEGMVGVVIANEAPLGTIAAGLRVRVQLNVAVGHVRGHCEKLDVCMCVCVCVWVGRWEI